MDTDSTVIEMLRSQIHEFESFGGPLYGLGESWTGRRFLDGVEHTTDRFHDHGAIRRSESYSLGHATGAHGSESTFVAVTTTSKPFDEEDLRWHLLVRAERRSPNVADLLEKMQADPVQPESRMMRTRVGADEVEFEVLSRGNYFSAKASMGETTVVVVGRGANFEDAPLQPIDDLHPYIEGMRQVARVNGISL